MWQILLTISIILIFAKVLRESAKRGLTNPAVTGIPELQQVALRRWIGACVVLIFLTNLVQGFVALARIGVLPILSFVPNISARSQWEDAIGGLWFLAPLLWFLFDWHRAWVKTLQAVEKQGYSPAGAAMLLRVVAGCAVAVSSYFMLLSAFGFDNRTH